MYVLIHDTPFGIYVSPIVNPAALKPAGPVINHWKLLTGFKAGMTRFTTQCAIELKHRYYIEVPIPSTSASNLAQLASAYG